MLMLEIPAARKRAMSSSTMFREQTPDGGGFLVNEDCAQAHAIDKHVGALPPQQVSACRERTPP
jgi:hypothetical protein